MWKDHASHRFFRGLLTQGQCRLLRASIDQRLEGDSEDLEQYSQLRIHHVRDPTFGCDAFNAIQQHLVQKVHGVEFNHLWYCSRYTVGGELASHCDNSVQRPDGSWSVATLLVYLNDGYVGGETQFLSNDRDERVIDKIVATTGDALLLRQDVLHRGEGVRQGTKYIARFDCFQKLTQ